MTTARWSRGLETGHAVVDGQHRQLFALVEEFEGFGADAASALDVAERIMEHVDDHFACEEALMDQVGYPLGERREHVADHLALKGQARQLILRLRTDDDFDAAELGDYLRSWLVRHTTNRDIGLVRYIAEHR
jgi:hemerythrin-like metal-binding protein